MIQIKDKGEPIEESDIIAIEKIIGIRLMEPYRSFLKNNNGGRPKPNIIDISGDPRSPTDVQVFFAINDEIESCTILWNYNILCKDLGRRDIIAIACDSSGNEFCLFTGGDETGKIFYYAFDVDPATFYFVSDSFDEFLQKLREWE